MHVLSGAKHQTDIYFPKLYTHRKRKRKLKASHRYVSYLKQTREESLLKGKLHTHTHTSGNIGFTV